MLRNLLLGRIMSIGLGRRPMLMQILMLAFMLPNSVVIVAVILILLAALIIPLMWLVLMAGSAASASSSDFYYQCDSAIGPDPSATETLAPTTAGSAGATDETLPSSVVPTTNPYAEVTVAPDESDVSDWQRACVSAMPSAPYQLPPLSTVNSGPAAACARQLALVAAQRPPGAGSGSAEAFAQSAQSLIYLASGASGTGSCAVGAAGVGATVQPLPPGVTAPSSNSAQGACNQLTNAASLQVALPNTIAAQSRCGQRVDRSAVSPGDLVFWNYHDYAPTRVGIAVDATRMVTSDPGSGQVVEEAIPTASDVRVKRVLKGGS
ncbi:C40 family peptidase [Nocardia sp. CA2R105]|uniref:NlpC/P60 family protein n=1 Tax=Nocardia coffeae TaxID=2873381 RepID=UPI001CA70043|nr:NlpC/P60 family protein [Nocardia coffeae]MBY8862733.1 C40 family peptidase [Nocardia coffeae]